MPILASLDTKATPSARKVSPHWHLEHAGLFHGKLIWNSFDPTQFWFPVVFHTYLAFLVSNLLLPLAWERLILLYHSDKWLPTTPLISTQVPLFGPPQTKPAAFMLSRYWPGPSRCHLCHVAAQQSMSPGDKATGFSAKWQSPSVFRITVGTWASVCRLSEPQRTKDSQATNKHQESSACWDYRQQDRQSPWSPGTYTLDVKQSAC